MKKLSIIIVSYNTEKITLECIDSICSVSSAENYEIIVVDNNSADNTVKSINIKFPLVKVIVNNGNYGFAKANNIGANNAAGKYLFFLNSDTYLKKKNSIALMTEYLDNNDNITAVAPRLFNTDNSIQQSVRFFPKMNIVTFLNYFVATKFHGCDCAFIGRGLMKINKITAPAEIEQPMGAALLIRKDDFFNAGAFNERYFMYMEDVELCYNIINKLNGRIIYLPAAEIYHYANASSNIVSDKAYGYFIDSMSNYFEKVCGYKKWKIKIFVSVGRLIKSLKKIIKKLLSLFSF